MKPLAHWLDEAQKRRVVDVLTAFHTAASEEIARYAAETEKYRLLLHDFQDCMRVQQAVNAALHREMSNGS